MPIPLTSDDLKAVIVDLDSHYQNKNDLLYESINKRLSKSLKAYYADLETTVNFLKTKNEQKVLKSINKNHDE